MKKVILTSVIFTAFALVNQAQINVQWETRYSGTGNNPDNVADMFVDGSGNIYVTGTSYNGSNFDIITRKYDNAGAVLWTSTFNGDGNGTDVAAALAVDASGNVFVTGYSYRGGTNYDITTIKYTSAGTQSWQAYSGNGTSAFDEGRDIAVDANNDVIVTGGVQNTAGSNTDFRTIKYTNAGTVSWTVDYSNSTNLDMGLALVTDASNNVYVTGHSFVTGQDLNIRTIKYNSAGTQQYNTATNYSTINSIDSPSKIVVNSSGEVYVAGRVFNGTSTDDDIVVMKYDAAGTVTNNTIIDGTANSADKANRIYLDASNNLYLAAKVKNTGTSEDFYLAKFNSSLGLIWDDSYNGPSNNYDEAADITIDASGTVYATGSSWTSSSNHDFVTVRYDGTTGDRVWITKFNGTANNVDKAKRISVDAAGNVYVSGDSKGSGTGDDFSTIKYCQLTTDAGPDVAICVNDSHQFNATGGSNFIWQNDPSLSSLVINNPTAAPSTTTTYIVSSTSGTGCVDYDTVEIVVNPLPGPTITASGPTSFCIGDSVILYANGFSSYSWSTMSTADSIIVYASGNYTVTVTDTMGCQNSTSQLVGVNNLPTVDAGTSDPYCEGGSDQLTATGADSFVWTPSAGLNDDNVNNPIVSTTTSGWYYVTGTDGNGCVNDDSVYVTVYPLPPAPNVTYVIATNLMVADSTSGIQWYYNGNPIAGGTGQTYVADSNGLYWAVFTNYHGCVSENSDTILVNTLSVESGFVSENQITVYPNPTNGIFYLETQHQFENLNFTILDATGRVIYTDYFNGGSKQIDLSGYSNGLYFIQFNTLGNPGLVRLIKQ
jgi:uncharacterized delta-60 repeat protein